MAKSIFFFEFLIFTEVVAVPVYSKWHPYCWQDLNNSCLNCPRRSFEFHPNDTVCLLQDIYSLRFFFGYSYLIDELESKMSLSIRLHPSVHNLLVEALRQHCYNLSSPRDLNRRHLEIK